MSDSYVVIEGLGKKFCRRLKRSLWYGIRDIGSELLGSKRLNPKLRKDEFWALKDINFELKKGELVGLIGPNGAGKTTLLKLLTGLIKPDEGSITIRGKIQALIALGAGFNPILTGRENIYINGAILGFTKKQLDGMFEDILEFSEIREFIDMPVQSYSSGMQVRLGFAVAVNLKPDILIVDEVLAVGDASFRRKARNKMMELLHSGISVLFVSHNMALISAITSRCIYLQRGRIAAAGPTEHVVTQYLHDSQAQIKKKYQQHGNQFMTTAFFTMAGIFVVKDVKLHNDAGNETDEFDANESINVQLDVEFLKEMEDVIFSISILDETDGLVISSSKFNPGIKKYKGAHRLNCTIFKSKLREGIYHLGFYALDYKGGALYKSNNVKSFSILADLKVIEKSDALLGLISIDTSWSIG